ncbi:MAG: SDR family oxidoreductase [Myxococcota bacterium]|nr:SDR family oxidoreductase [Myxococcota bacterium]
MADRGARRGRGGPTAWVTGASAGIGRAFARELARRGWRLRLVARRRGRLEELAAQLEAEHGVEARVEACDLTDPEALRRLEGRLTRDRRAELLVNDAGMGDFGDFVASRRDVLDRMVRLNTLALVRLGHAAASGMARRGRGAIVNVSSSAAFQPGPRFAIYAATKAFVNSFSEALAFELRDHGVRVQALCPGLTHTEIFRRAGADTSALPGFLWMEPDAVVEESLASLERDAVVCVPGLGNRVLTSVSQMVPHEISERIAEQIMGRVETRPRGRGRRRH